MEKGSLQKHPPPSSSRKLGRQEVDGALGPLGLGKSKLKDKLSAIRQDRAERRESLQKQDAIHEVDSSEDETDEGSEDSQEGRRGAAFTPPPLLRPTTVRTGPGGTLPSLCLSPCTSHATFSHTGPPLRQPSAAEPRAAVSSQRSTGDQAGRDGTAPGASGPPQRPPSFSTPGSAFISVSKDSFLRPAPPRPSRTARSTAAPPQPDGAAAPGPAPPEPTSTARSPDLRTPGAQETSGPSPSVSKEKKEADNRRLAASSSSSSSSSSCPDRDQLATQTAEARHQPPGERASSAQRDCAAPPCRDTWEAPASGSARPGPPSLRSEPAAAAASEPKRKRSDPLSAASSAAAASSQRDKAASKKT